MTETTQSLARGQKSLNAKDNNPPLRLHGIRDHGAYMALFIAFAIFGAFAPSTFLSSANLFAILDQSVVPLIIVSGLTFVIITGGIDLSIEGIIATASLSFVLLSANSKNVIDLGIFAYPLTMLIGALFGVVTGLLHTRLKIPSFMASLGLWFIGLGFGTVLYGTEVPMLTDPVTRSWLSITHGGVSNAVIVAVIFLTVAWLISRHTKMGRFAYAIGSNETIARLNGVSVDNYKVLIYAYSGFCTAVAAIVASSRLGVGAPDVGSGQLFLSAAAVIVGGTPLTGGRGGIAQSVAGVLLLVVVSNGLVLIGASPITQQALSGLIVVAAVIVSGLSKRNTLRIVK